MQPDGLFCIIFFYNPIKIYFSVTFYYLNFLQL
jgi:hypothetical protein